MYVLISLFHNTTILFVVFFLTHSCLALKNPFFLFFLILCADVNLTLPVPEVTPIGKKGRYNLKETKLVKHSNNKRDLRIAMVVKIQDETSNNTYYEWQVCLL